MKEIFSKTFWHDVKKTFEDAKEGVPSEVVPPTAAIPPAPAPQDEPAASTDTGKEESTLP